MEQTQQMTKQTRKQYTDTHTDEKIVQDKKQKLSDPVNADTIEA